MYQRVINVNLFRKILLTLLMNDPLYNASLDSNDASKDKTCTKLQIKNRRLIHEARLLNLNIHLCLLFDFLRV